MATILPPSEAQSAAPDLDAFEHHWQDEADAAFLYRLLADAEPDPKKQDIYRRLADVEDRHLEIWAALLAQHGRVLLQETRMFPIREVVVDRVQLLDLVERHAAQLSAA